MRSVVRDRPGTLVISQGDDTQVSITVTGRLDRTLGEQLVEVVEAGLAIHTTVLLNVSKVRDWTWAGIDALGACIDLGAIVASPAETARFSAT